MLFWLLNIIMSLKKSLCEKHTNKQKNKKIITCYYVAYRKKVGPKQHRVVHAAREWKATHAQNVPNCRGLYHGQSDEISSHLKLQPRGDRNCCIITFKVKECRLIVSLMRKKQLSYYFLFSFFYKPFRQKKEMFPKYNFWKIVNVYNINLIKH